MQDRFKFRAWDRTKNKYIYDVQEGVFSDISGMPIYFFEDFLDDDFYTVEQCTGQKDKNGKLIYEGDIIQDRDVETGEDVFYVVKFDDQDPAFYLDANHRDYSVELYDVEIGYLEVVGNIHENPELTEEQNG